MRETSRAYIAIATLSAAQHYRPFEMATTNQANEREKAR